MQPRLPWVEEGSSSSAPSQYGKPSALGLKCRIFLSHSGADKEFVADLHQELFDRSYDAFYDKDTLPKAVVVSMDNILPLVRDAELGILVLSDDFFMRTPYPMQELAEFIRCKVQLLPLFYKVSVDVFKQKSRQALWEEMWRKWVSENRIQEACIEKWREALCIVSRTNGLERVTEAANDLEYIDKVVDEVCSILPPAVRYLTKEEINMDRMCQIVSEMYECAAACSDDQMHRRSYITPVVAVHGFPGAGKSTLCKALCDFFYSAFKGRVCLIELDSKSHHHHTVSYYGGSNALSLQPGDVFMQLSYHSSAAKNRVDSDYCQVHHRLVGRHVHYSSGHPVFLALDNVEEHSEKHVQSILRGRHFPEGSKIFITSRSPVILQRLTRNHKYHVVENFPHLNVREASNIFLSEVYGHGDTEDINVMISEEEENVVSLAVHMCTLNFRPPSFRVSLGDFNPIMLRCVASYLADTSLDPFQWRRLLSGGYVMTEQLLLRGFNCAWTVMFDILENSYNQLEDKEKRWLIAFCLYPSSKWLQLVHFVKEDHFEHFISKLKGLSFMDGSNSLLNLVEVFTKRIAERLDDEYLLVEGEQGTEVAQKIQSIQSYETLRHVTVSGCTFEEGSGKLDLSDLPRIEVLYVVENDGLEEVLLSRSTSQLLRSLTVLKSGGEIVTITVIVGRTSGMMFEQEPTIGKKLRWVDVKNCEVRFRSSTSSSSNINVEGFTLRTLAFLQMTGIPVFGVDNLSAILQLQELSLSSLDVMGMAFDFHNCSQLRNFCAYSLQHVQSRIRFVNCPKLRSVYLSTLSDVKFILLDNCPELENISLYYMRNLEVITGLDNCKSLVSTIMCDCHKISSLSLPDRNSRVEIQYCKALERITLIGGSQLFFPQLVPGGGSSELKIMSCSRLTTVDGLSSTQSFEQVQINSFSQGYRTLEKTYRDMMKFAGIDSSPCRAVIHNLHLIRSISPGLGGLKSIKIVDVQYFARLIRALHATMARALESLSVRCREGVCGCDIEQPHFDLLITSNLRELHYRCLKVEDLSRLGQHTQMQVLDLEGCRSVQKWPDFANMVNLKQLSLQRTSLIQCLDKLLGLPLLYQLHVEGCIALPAKELMRVVTCGTLMHARSADICVEAAFRAMKDDLVQSQTRKAYTVADAIMACSQELIDLMHRGNSLTYSTFGNNLCELLYAVCFEAEAGAQGINDERVKASLKPLLSGLAKQLLHAFPHSPPWEQDWTILSMYMKSIVSVPYEGLHGRTVAGCARKGSLYLVLIGLAGSLYGSLENVVEGNLEEGIWSEIVKSFVNRPRLRDDKYGLITLYGLKSFDKLDPAYTGILFEGSEASDTAKCTMVKEELLAVRVADAVCKLARVSQVAALLGEHFLQDFINPLAQRVQHDYRSFESQPYLNLYKENPSMMVLF